jgi:DNA-binding HxlR family transcriptional regulator
MAQRAKKIAEENSHHDCDFRDMLSRVGDKWSLLVIFILKGRPAFRARFSDLKRSIPGISQQMLTATVRNLERDGMLTRHVYAEVPPRVEYELTPLGRGLTEPVLGLVSWLQSNWSAIRSARDRFDARKMATRTVARPVASATIRS